MAVRPTNLILGKTIKNIALFKNMIDKYHDCLKYINQYWDKSTFSVNKDQDGYFALPNKFVSPNHARFTHDQFYWDSYFIILGLIEANKIELAKGMVDNFIYEQNKFNKIPARNRFQTLSYSQPPFLTSMTLEIYKRTTNKIWLKKALAACENELRNYWQTKAKAYCHLVYEGLSRYCDRTTNNYQAEHESGWDMTSRFDNKCLHYLPVDLNCCLYKYETDIAKIYKILGNKSKYNQYLKKALGRRDTINRLMWDQKYGFYFDFNYIKETKSHFFSLAGFFPLWAGLADEKQAEKMTKNLKKFEYAGGLAATQKNDISVIHKQWDYPNGWANLMWIVIDGLRNYGYENHASRLCRKWLDLNTMIFAKTHKMWESYDVVNLDIGMEGRYEVQEGFGWTNAVYLKLYKTFFKNK